MHSTMDVETDRATFLYQWKEGLFAIMLRISATDVHRAFGLHQSVYMPLAAEWIRATELEGATAW